METRENAGTVKPFSARSTQLFILSIIIVQIIVALLAYPFLPDTVPTHWNATGQIDGYGPKWVDTLMFPAISIGIYLLMRFLFKISPKLGSDTRKVNVEIVDHILAATFLLLLIIQLVVLTQIFHLPVDFMFVMSLTLSAMILYIGNYLGKLRRNFWAGVRTPWTLVNDTVWERTHRFTGWLFVASGLLGMVLSFVPGVRIWGIVGLLLLDTVLATVYSYIVYRRVMSKEQSHLSPPFDSGA